MDFGIAAAEIVPLARINSYVLAVLSATCGVAGVVAPVAQVREHWEPADSAELCAVKTILAWASPELATVVTNVVLPHPAEVVGADEPVSSQTGRTSLILSLMAMFLLTNTNSNESAVGVATYGVSTTNFGKSVGTTTGTTAVDFTNGVGGTSDPRALL